MEEKLLKLLTKNFKLLCDTKYSYNINIWDRVDKQYFHFTQHKENLISLGYSTEDALLQLRSKEYTSHFWFKELSQLNNITYIDNIIFSTGKPVKNSLKTAWSFSEYSYIKDINYCCSINTDRIIEVVEPIISNPVTASILPFAASLVLQTSLINPPNEPGYMLNMAIPFSDHLILDNFHLYQMYNDLDSLLNYDLIKEGYRSETRNTIRYQFAKMVSDLVSNSDNWKETHTVDNSINLFI